MGFLVAALAVTWPWALHPTSTLIGPVGGDVSSSVAKWNAIAEAGVIPFAKETISTIGWPVGMPTQPGLDSVSFLSTMWFWLGALTIGAVASHSLLGVVGFTLTALVTFLCVRRVTGSAWAGVVAGVAYGFFPHMYGVAYAATTYTWMWLLILPIWAFWELARDPSARRALTAGLAMLPAAFWTPYFAIHAGVISVACLGVLLVVAPRVGLARRLLALTALPWAAGAVAYVAIGFATSFADVPTRDAGDAYQQAAQPLMFVMPGAGSIWPDSLTRELVHIVPRARDANLYVGISVLVLAAIAIVAALRRWRARRSEDRRLEPTEVAILLAIAVVVASALCSLPPKVAGGHIPMPSLLIHETVPALRAGQRFVMPLMAGLAVLAGIGADVLLRRLSGRRATALAVVLVAAVGVDLSARFPGMNGRLPEAGPAIEALARAPDAPAIHLTVAGAFAGIPQRGCILQETHHKPLFNNCGWGTIPEASWELGVRLSMCDMLEELRRRGLRYVIVDLPIPSNIGQCFAPKGRLVRATLLAEDRADAVWRLPA